ncbi:phage protein NinX family protein [Pantoea eucrina]|uniref:phage protein NinX family protein n=1 Tax=Pantoea eucrina TaxID=472693 RepID=UPI001CC5325F|nr:phage protein NinX family protein [Pantoea eucrina]UBB12373.1 DUF2591 domain-containing protein [Pantoea eucrina]
MNYSEMTDFEINKAVAIAEGHSCYYGDGSFTNGLMGRKVTVKGNGVIGCMDFCNSWADAGPIIEANKIAMIPESDGTWFALGNPQIKSNWRVQSTGAFHNDTTPLRAAMIVFLMMQEASNV